MRERPGPGRSRRRGLGGPPPEGVSAHDAAPFGWAPIVVLFLVGIVDRLESSVIAGVLPLIQQEWGVSDTWLGAIPTAAAIAGAIVTLPAGYVADRYNRTNLIAVVVAVWSLVTLGSALAISFAMFFATRVVLGAADSIDNPAGSSVLADTYPPLTRARVFGWQRLTTYAGMGLGVIIGGVVGEAFGWRWAFGVMVVPGLVVAWLCWILREPVRGFLDQVVAAGTDERHPVPAGPDDEARSLRERLTGRARDRDDASDARQRLAQQLDFRQQLRDVARIPTLRLLCVGLTAMGLGLSGIIYWLPTLLARAFELGEARAGTIAGGLGILGVVGGVSYGGRLGRLWHTTRQGGRMLAGGGGLLLGAALLGLSLLVDALLPFALLLLVAFFLMAISIPNLTACVADVIISSSRGIGFALIQFLVTLGGAFGPLIVGLVSDATGSLRTAMYALVVPQLLGALLIIHGRRHFDRDAGLVLDQARAQGPVGGEQAEP